MNLPKILAAALLAAGLVTGVSSAGVHAPFHTASSVVQTGAADVAHGHRSAAPSGPSAAGTQRGVLIATVTIENSTAGGPLAAKLVTTKALGAARAEAQPHTTVRARTVAARSRAAAGASANTPVPTPPNTVAPPATAAAAPTTTAPTPTTPTTVAAPTPVAAPTTTDADGYGCADALTYLSHNAAPGFTFECPGFAEGHQAMTCVNTAGVCGGEKLIAINDPCQAAYMNEASNSWRAMGESTAPIDPFGSCG